MNVEQIEKIVRSYSTKRLLVVGDLMLDEYIVGNVERISPEAPVQVVEVKKEKFTIGGAGNVAENIVSLNAAVSVCGVIGNNSDGRRLRKKLEDSNIDTAGIVVDDNRPTTRKTRIIGPMNQQVLRIDWEVNKPVSEKTQKHIFQYFVKNVSQFDAVIVSDYAKGVITRPLINKITACCRERRLPLVVDPKGKNYARYREATMITPNLREISQEYGRPIKTEDELIKAADYLIEKHSFDSVLVTRSSEGMTLVRQGKRPVTIPAIARDVFDVSGAGDTVAAVMGLSLAGKVSYEVAATIANMAAGIVVGKVGTAAVVPEEIISYTQRYYFRNKIIDPDSLKKIITAKQQTGKKFVFTHGHFNILKYEFVKFFQKARHQGDFLIVGINSDYSLKSLNRQSPLSENERSHIISSLDCVDYVVLFDSKTPEELVQKLSPDIFIDNDCNN
ncbi:MAG: D-glycero-beta-D-manno-heptose-7-phosphate kinase [bacterium]